MKISELKEFLELDREAAKYNLPKEKQLKWYRYTISNMSPFAVEKLIGAVGIMREIDERVKRGWQCPFCWADSETRIHADNCKLAKFLVEFEGD